MIKLKKRGEETTGLMLSPMIDMIFLLLIFFIVSAMYMTESNAIQVKLPKSATGALQNTELFNVTVKEDGSYWLKNSAVDERALINRIKEGAREDKNFAVIIRADERAPYGYVIRLLDILKKEGVHKVSLATDRGKTP